MQQSTTTRRPVQHSVAIDEVTGLREHGLAQKLLGSQPFWVTVALVVICLVMSYLQPEAFATYDNFYNITRNFAFVGLMALGMTAVILTGGIDISVGSIMGLVGVVCGVILEAEWHWFFAVAGGLAAGALAGAVNGALVAYAGLPSFVVTLGMLSIARSLAVVLSGNRMIYEFGPYGEAFNGSAAASSWASPTRSGPCCC
jgi:ribose transport system permease protein